MGLLRLYLALSVLLGHSLGLFGFMPPQGVEFSVQVFYFLSGLYISAIIRSRFSSPDWRSYLVFLGDRFIRLWPSYVIVGAATILYCAATGRIMLNSGAESMLKAIPVWQFILIAASNLFMAGQDLFLFFYYDPTLAKLRYTPELHVFEAHAASALLLVPPAWSLGVEILFYATAPVLLFRGAGFTVVLIALSLALRAVLFACGLKLDPWTYRFFPSEVAVFLAGHASFLLYERLKGVAASRVLAIAASALVVLYLSKFAQITRLAYAVWPDYTGADYLARGGFLALMLLSAPFLFGAFNGNPIDRFLAQLSYPVYLVHFLILDAVLRSPAAGGVWQTPVVIALSIGISVLLVLFVERPVERARHAFVRSSNAKRSHRKVPMAS